MAKKEAEIKASLMKEAEKIIDELIDWKKEVKRPNFSQIEEEVLKLRERLSEKMAAEISLSQEEVKPVPGPGCKKCGKEMSYKGQKRKEVKSWVGKVELERGYYYCEDCEGGLFPPR